MRYELEIDGQRVVAEAQWIGGQLWVHLNGRTFPYESESQQKQKRTKATGGKAGDVVAPMPGKVTKVLAKAGDDLQKGDAVLVMEAMKMEYTLKAEGPGRVESVDCAVGDQVTLGKVLVKISPKHEE